MYYKLNKKYSIGICIIYMCLGLYLFPFFIICTASIGEGIYETTVHYPNYFTDQWQHSKNKDEIEKNTLPAQNSKSNVDVKSLEKSMNKMGRVSILFFFTWFVFCLSGIFLLITKRIFIILIPLLYIIIFLALSKSIEQGYFLRILSNQFGGSPTFMGVMSDIWGCFLEAPSMFF